jgi:DNA primase
MATQSDTELLNKVPIAEVGKLLGLNLPRQGMTRCPLSTHVDKNPSFSIYASGLRWHCFSCGESGGSIDLVKAVRRIPFLEAKLWLRDMLRTPTFQQPIPKRTAGSQRQSFAKSQIDCLLPQSSAVLREFLKRSPLADSGKRYLSARGFTSKTISYFKIGQTSSPQKLIRNLVAEFGFDIVQSSGLLTKNSTPNKIVSSIWDDCIVVPFFHGDTIEYLQGRSIKENPRRKWYNLSGRNKRIFNVDVLNSSSPIIWICESAFDAMSAYELGHEAIGLLGSTGAILREHIQHLKNKEIRLSLDWDPVGQTSAMKIKMYLYRFGIPATITPTPMEGIKDLNEYLIMKRLKK